MKIINKFLQEVAEDRSFEKKDSVKGILKDDDGKILLMRRQEGTPGAGQWDLPGGCIEIGENKEDALKRETMEECGLKIKNIKKAGMVTLKIPESGVNSDMYLFTCECENTDVQLKPATWKGSDGKTEHNQILWLTNKIELEGLPMLDILKKELNRYVK